MCAGTLTLAAAGAARASPPANDDFAFARLLSGLSGTASGTNAEAIAEAGEPDHAGIVASRSVWFAWIAPSSGGTTFDTGGSSFDTLLGVYTGSSVDALTEVASNDNFGGLLGTRSRVTFQTTAGTTYTIAVDGKLAAAGPLTLNWIHYGNPTAPPGSDPILLAAGDIAGCDRTGDEATALVISGLAGTVATLGDNVYDAGTAAQYSGCYDPNWGNFKARTRPAPGNHEYQTPGAAGYFDYFGALAGDRAKGYYSYDLGAWHLVSLNGNCSFVGGCGAGSAQLQWLAADLASRPAACTLAYWHQARFSSGAAHGSDAAYQPIWQALYDAGADVVLAGHDHVYERFAPQTPSGSSDPAFGVREFVVGTGGASHYAFGTPIANSEVREANTYGVLRLALHAAGYDWEFAHEAGKTFTDTGTAGCHGAPGPTVARLRVLRATTARAGIAITWRTASESGWIGFDLLREGAGLERLNARLIPAAAGGGTRGGLHRFVDRTARPGRTYLYRLRAVTAAGARVLVGSIRATLPRPRG